MSNRRINRRTFVKSSALTAGAVSIPGFYACTPAGKKPEEVKGKTYDAVVYGATPGGVACAVRLAREGSSVLLITYNDRMGGMLTSGLGVWDTLYEGYRAPIYDELRKNIFDYYKNTYGEDSETYQRALPGETGHTNGTFEAHVAEKLVNELVANESNIEIIYNHYPASVGKEGSAIRSISLKETLGDNELKVAGNYFVDGSYEGDLMAAAGAHYRIGREAKSEFNEKHAGKIFMDRMGESEWNERQERIFTNLNFRHFGHHQNIIYPASTHEADDRVQAYNMRYYTTKDPNNQIKLQPSDQYDPEFLKTLEFSGPDNPIKPNGKCGLNRPQLVPSHNAYVEGDWETRYQVIEDHIKATRDIIYWIQNDPSAPADRKKQWEGWGLAADEFTENNNNPYEIYVREARRLVGKHVYTENDLALHTDYDRTPLHHDSIGIIEWYQDCHACTKEQVEMDNGKMSMDEGKMMIHKETFIGQFPYRSIVCEEVDNLIVPVCMSTTHVAWGAVRLEPTWMQLGESAAYAILQASQTGQSLNQLDTDKLCKTLAQKRSLITFFNDFYVDDPENWVPAIQYFGLKGYFPTYHARPQEPVDKQTAELWVQSYASKDDGIKVENTAINLMKAAGQPASLEEVNSLLAANNLPELNQTEGEVSRAALCLHLFKQLG